MTSLGYSSVSDCTKRMYDANCTQSACDPGTNCLDSLQAQSCADFTAGMQPVACSYSCLPGSVGSGGAPGNGGSGAWGGNGGSAIYGGWGGDGGNVVSNGGNGAGGSSGSGLAAVAACNDAITAICERSFYCGGAAALAELGYSSTSDCIRGKQSSSCTSRAPCGPGETFDLDQAKRCIDGLRAESCPDLKNGVDPAACAFVCRGEGGGIGGGYGYGGWAGDVGGWAGSVGGWAGDVGGWGGDVGGWAGSVGGWAGDVGGWGGWGGDLGGQSGQSGWPSP